MSEKIEAIKEAIYNYIKPIHDREIDHKDVNDKFIDGYLEHLSEFEITDAIKLQLLAYELNDLFATFDWPILKNIYDRAAKAEPGNLNTYRLLKNAGFDALDLIESVIVSQERTCKREIVEDLIKTLDLIDLLERKKNENRQKDYYSYGLAYYYEEEYFNLSEENLKKALENPDYSLLSSYYLANLYRKKAEYEKSIELYLSIDQDLLEEVSGIEMVVLLRQYLAISYLRNGQVEKATEEFTGVLELVCIEKKRRDKVIYNIILTKELIEKEFPEGDLAEKMRDTLLTLFPHRRH